MLGVFRFGCIICMMAGLFSETLGTGSYYNFTTMTVGLNKIEVETTIADVSAAMGADNKISNAMIVNGWEAQDSKFPFMVSIQILEEPYKRYHICGAVLIATNKALTAAHCMYYWGYMDHYAAVGFNRLSQHGQALVKITDALIHNNYNDNQEGYPNDIAIITFEEHVELTDKVQLANLTEPGDPEYSNQYCYIAGWGLTEDYYYGYPDELRYAVLLHLEKRDCKKFFKVFQIGQLVRNHHTCAWLWPYTSCYGDSGGPLICGGQVVGLTSWAADCTGCFPVVFAKISAFWNWIETNA